MVVASPTSLVLSLPPSLSLSYPNVALMTLCQLTSTSTCLLPQGTGWNHAYSDDLVNWSTGPHGPAAVHETYAGMDSKSDPCSGFITKDPNDDGRVCAGFRQCGSNKGVEGGKPWDVPLELRCATDKNLTAWDDAHPEYLFNVSFWRAIPYDPARPWQDADGMWYTLLSMDGCNGTAHPALPCHAGGELVMWTSPALRGPKADWQKVGPVVSFLEEGRERERVRVRERENTSRERSMEHAYEEENILFDCRLPSPPSPPLNTPLSSEPTRPC